MTDPSIYGHSGPNHSEQGRAVASMFGRITRWYDCLNTLLSCGMDRVWRQRLVREALTACPRRTGRVLDLAAGTLDVSLALRGLDPTRCVLALDFCLPMLLAGQPKLYKLRGENRTAVKPVVADALHLPLPDASVDAVTIAFGIRNIVSRHTAFAEIVRVLVPGGRLCILEFGSGKQRVWGGLYNVYLERILPALGRWFSSDSAYAYLAHSIRAFPRALELEEELRASGFVRARHIPLTSGIVCLHMAEKAL